MSIMHRKKLQPEANGL